MDQVIKNLQNAIIETLNAENRTFELYRLDEISEEELEKSIVWLSTARGEIRKTLVLLNRGA